MKILLLTDIPPCKDYTAGIVQDQLCRFLPEGSVVCFAVVNRTIPAKLSADLKIPIEYCKKPVERAFRLLPTRLGEVIAKWVENWREKQIVNTILPKVVAFGKKHQVDRVWCILQGQTMVRLAQPVAESLGVPLHTQVWDPLAWWLRANKIDAVTSAKLLEKFDAVIKASKSCATASWAMSKEYTEKYGVPNIPVISSLPSESAILPASAPNQSDEFVIGLAGQIYATVEWNALILAIEKFNWEIDGKKIKFRILSRGLPSGIISPKYVEYLGWMTQKEAIENLSRVDILYLPYWFSPEFCEEARLSFPSKLITYLAAGRPILFHGPSYASPGRYLDENNAGVCCHSLEPEHIFEKINLLATNTDIYQQMAFNGAVIFNRDFTHKKMMENFYEFIM